MAKASNPIIGTSPRGVAMFAEGQHPKLRQLADKKALEEAQENPVTGKLTRSPKKAEEPEAPEKTEEQTESAEESTEESTESTEESQEELG